MVTEEVREHELCAPHEAVAGRGADYSSIADKYPWVSHLNLLITISAFVLGASTLILMYNFIVSWRHGKLAGDNPWRALTIEWNVSSPPPIFNFDGAPRVVGGPYNYGQPGAKHVVFDEPKPDGQGH